MPFLVLLPFLPEINVYGKRKEFAPSVLYFQGWSSVVKGTKTESTGINYLRMK